MKLRFSFIEAALAIGTMVVQVAGVRTNYNPLQPDDFCRRHSHASEYPDVAKTYLLEFLC